MTDRTKPPRPKAILVGVVVIAAAFLIWSRVNRQLDDGRSAEEVVSFIAIALVIVAAILAALYWGIFGKQKAQLRAISEQEPASIAFTSFALQNVAAYLKSAIPALGLGQKVKGVTLTSPTAVADAAGFRLVYGGSRLKVAYFIPRDRIAGVGVDEVQEGLYTYPLVCIAVNGNGTAAVIPVPVARQGSTMRRGSLAEAEAIVARLSTLWGITAPATPADESAG